MSERPPTLQDILKRQQAGGFVGRVEQLGRFEDNLRLGADDVRRKFLFSLHGGAGVGKTTLLRQLVGIAQNQGYVTGFVDEVAYDVPSSLELIHADLEQQSVRCKRLHKRLTAYRQRRLELDSDPRAPSPLARSMVAVALSVASEVPFARTVAGRLDADTVTEEIARYQEYLRRKFRNPDVVQLLLSPAKVLTPAFLEDLREVAETQSIALFFDTYEYTGTFLEPWLLDLLAGHFGAVPPNIVLTLAGQHPLALNKWSGYLLARADLPVAPFTDDEARRLLAVRGVTDADVVDAILGRSGRLPLLVASYSEGSPDSLAELGDPTNDVVERFLKWEPEPQRRMSALLGALPRTLNLDIFAVVADSTPSAQDYARLRSLSFVQEHSDGLRYHGLAREVMVRQIRRTTPGDWQRRHRALAGYFRATRDALGLTGRAAWKNERWQRLAMEEHYHAMCAGGGAALPAALGGLATGYAWLPAMAARWARTIHQAGTDADDAYLIRRGDQLATWAESGTDGDRIRLLSALAEDSGLDPHTRAIGYAERGDIRRGRDEFGPALADLNRAVDRWPEMDWIVAYRGELFRLSGRHDEALADFDRAIEIRPDYKWAWGGRAQTYVGLGRTDDALASFARAIEIDPGYGWALLKRAGLLQALGRPDEAVTDLRRVAELDHSNTWSLGELARLLDSLGRHDEALAEFNRAIEIDPDDDWVLTGRAQTLRQLGRSDEALRDLTRAVDIDPNYAWPLVERAHLLLDEFGRDDEALADFNQAVGANPDNAWALANRAQAQVTLGRYDDALTDFDHAIEIDPGYVWASVKRALLLDDLDRTDDALVGLNRAIDIDPDKEWPLAIRAEAHAALGHVAAALADFDRAIEINPGYTWAIAKRARLLSRLGRLDDALDELDRAAVTTPDSDDLLDERAVVHRLMGRYDQALADLDRSVEINPALGWTHFQAALVLRAQNRAAEARERLTRAAEVERAHTTRIPADAWRAFNVAVYLLALDEPEQAQRQLRETLSKNVTPKDIRTAIEDFEELRAATGHDVTSCLTILRSALPGRRGVTCDE